MNARRLMFGAVAGLAVVLMASATAWACVSGPAVHFSSVNAQPGDQIMVSGSNFNVTNPVSLRLNSLTGPILATLQAPTDSSSAMGSFTVPIDAKPGPNVVIMTQSANGKLVQAPIRAVINVTTNGSSSAAAAPLAASGAPRPDGLTTTSSSVATGSLVLVGLGVGGVAIFLAGLVVFFAGRRTQHEPVAVRSR